MSDEQQQQQPYNPRDPERVGYWMDVMDQMLADDGKSSLDDYTDAELNESLEAMKEERRAKKRQRISFEDPYLHDYEQTILGLVLADEKNSAERWFTFRNDLGVKRGPIPEWIWTTPERRMVGVEMDAIYLGRRAVTSLDAVSVKMCYHQRSIDKPEIGSTTIFSLVIDQLVEYSKKRGGIDFYASCELLRSQVANRRLNTLKETMDYMRASADPPDDVVKEIETALDETRAILGGRIQADLSIQGLKDLSDIEEAMDAPPEAIIPTGVFALDMDMGGGILRQPLEPNMYLIGARSGVGKSQLGVTAACGLLMNGGNVLFASSELMSRQVKARVFSNLAYRMGFECPFKNLEKPGVGRPPAFDAAKEAVHKAMAAGEIGSYQQHCKVRMDVEEFDQLVSRAKDKNPDLDAVFLDHFHYMTPLQGYKGNEVAEMKERIERIAAICRDNRVELFCMVQLNRAADGVDGPLEMSHVWGGDAMNFVASAVWLTRKKKNPDGSTDWRELELFHAKTRTAQIKRDGSEDHVPMSRLHRYGQYSLLTDADAV